jgi:hypothetical protein
MRFCIVPKQYVVFRDAEIIVVTWRKIALSRRVTRDANVSRDVRLFICGYVEYKIQITVLVQPRLGRRPRKAEFAGTN